MYFSVALLANYKTDQIDNTPTIPVESNLAKKVAIFSTHPYSPFHQIYKVTFANVTCKGDNY